MLEIVAEIGASHGQDLGMAKSLIEGAIHAGADWVKLQTYTPDTISFQGSGICPSGPWKGRPLYELYQAAHMPRKMQADLVDWMHRQDIAWFSTPFSPEDVDFLESMNCLRYKISSFDVANEPLIRAVRMTGAPLVFSDGMDRTIPGALDPSDVVLRCVSQYPATPEDYGLGHPPRMQIWGVSDHTDGSLVGAVAVSMGAQMIEKHVRLDDDDESEDSAFATSLERFEMEVALWRKVHRIAVSTQAPVSPLQSIRPRPIERDGATVWKRYV